jgi:hypothetical protein
MKLPKFSGILRAFGPRVLASVFGGVATYIGVKSQGAIQIDAEAAATTVTGILLSYAAAHKAVSSKVNPGDSAEGRIIEAEKDAVDHGVTVKPAPPPA